MKNCEDCGTELANGWWCNKCQSTIAKMAERRAIRKIFEEGSVWDMLPLLIGFLGIVGLIVLACLNHT